VASVPTSADLAGLYRDTRERLAGLLGSLGGDDLAAPVPACPGWSVHDVVAHLTAVTDDALAGRLTGPPSDELTAEQVARFRDVPLDRMLETWTELSPRFEEMIAAFEVWPAVLDLAAHEQDIRGALGRPGGRDAEVVRVGAERLITLMQPPVPVTVRVEDAEFSVGPDPAGVAPLTVDTTRFEALRWRLGRRSRAQLAALAWSADPAPVLDHLVVFGPSPEDIHE
jgi:uncharacterized protein (TIGR03083 family)